MKCPNCGTKIPGNKIKKELRRCSKCDEPIGCIRCRTPGTFAFKFCALHDPRGAFTDDKLFNPHQKEVAKVTEATSSQRTEIKKLIKLLEKECREYEYGIYDDYEKLEKITKPAANRLIKIGKPAVPELIKLFRDKRRKKKSGIMHIAAHILGGIKDERTLKPLCEALYREPDIAKTAANALMKFGDAAISSIEKMIFLLGDVSNYAAYALCGIESKKSCDLLILGIEYRIKLGEWENADRFLLHLTKYSENFNDRRALNYLDNIDRRKDKWGKIISDHHDWRKYLPPAAETFYDVIEARENELNKLNNDKEVRRFLRGKFKNLEKTPEVNLAYNVLKKDNLRGDYDWMLTNHEFMDGLFWIHRERFEREKQEFTDEMGFDIDSVDADSDEEMIMRIIGEMIKRRGFA
ncbi:MAG: hypothetical protein A7315_00120 [Candidatus Altiarchaeales archaeon WOR_SM1_79]|nr:MAG: hypothetical protein A7315_00120 [Candidatus Altiarchaeales archaeon WOR_SM1_79]